MATARWHDNRPWARKQHTSTRCPFSTATGCVSKQKAQYYEMFFIVQKIKIYPWGRALPKIGSQFSPPYNRPYFKSFQRTNPSWRAGGGQRSSRPSRELHGASSCLFRLFSRRTRLWTARLLQSASVSASATSRERQDYLDIVPPVRLAETQQDMHLRKVVPKSLKTMID